MLKGLFKFTKIQAELLTHPPHCWQPCKHGVFTESFALFFLWFFKSFSRPPQTSSSSFSVLFQRCEVFSLFTNRRITSETSVQHFSACQRSPVDAKLQNWTILFNHMNRNSTTDTTESLKKLTVGQNLTQVHFPGPFVVWRQLTPLPLGLVCSKQQDSSDGNRTTMSSCSFAMLTQQTASQLTSVVELPVIQCC